MYPETFKIDTREKVAHFYEYSPILDKFEIKYLEDEYWLICGTLSFDNKWILMLAMRTSQTPKVLEDILDLLSEREVPFRIIKNQVLHYQLNSNFVSLGESAKAFTIFTRSDDECAYLIPKLQVLTNQYSGPQIEGALKIGSILYVAHSKITKLNGSGFEFSFKKPKPSALPIRLKRDDLIAPNPFKKIIGRNYILIETIRDDAKCSIYKAIKFKKLRFELCIIKRGKAHHNDDHFDRDIRDRLIWQHRVICKLQDKLRTAKVISIFKESEDICLVLEHVEGVILEHKMFYIKKNLPWRLLKSEDRSAILKYYLKIISIIRIIHENDMSQILHLL
ncbi:MAG: hypothetical protein J0H07_27265 [Sphingobacteriales bacterium]|nr:hypothetical protein [Sphingobacteriales bacterium]